MSRNISPKELAWWHRRYVRQAEWTRALRYHLYRQVGIARCSNILEIGCGTGVIANELAERTASAVFGLDNDATVLVFAGEKASNKKLIWLAGDAGKLPFRDDSLDLIVTHYFWLWAEHSDTVCSECRRVLKKGGALAALAEPDYSARQDFPDGIPFIKEFLINDLKKKGANPSIGKKLVDLFTGAGFDTVAGSANDKVTFMRDPKLFWQEWELLERLGYPADELTSIKGNSSGIWMTMPVHWAVGKKNRPS